MLDLNVGKKIVFLLTKCMCKLLFVAQKLTFDSHMGIFALILKNFVFQN